MADTSCGPSSAFKGLARHVEQDRSHQQDRVVAGSRLPVQNFRSTPFNAGPTEQFGRFQQQNATLPHPSQPASIFDSPNDPARSWFGAPNYPTQGASSFPSNGQTPILPVEGSAWFHEFKRGFNVSPVQREHASIPFPEQAPALPGSAWHGELDRGLHHLRIDQRHHAGAGLANMHSPQTSATALPSGPAFPVWPPNPSCLYPNPRGFSPIPAPIPDSIHHPLGMQAGAELDQEFEDAMNKWMLQNGPGLEKNDELHARNSDNLTSSTDAISAAVADKTLQEDLAESGNDDAELARAAQQLVGCLADNDSEKFKNSEFLSLMRRIASQQVTVQGNDLVEKPQLSTSSDAGPASSSADTSPADFVDRQP
ncbi:hypothetical protein F4777DRAFT_553172 [Nemania sp. FL0916]|nr:hypothetical protein F4777DRAFT_553172 [Nemania sp. FL0916]